MSLKDAYAAGRPLSRSGCFQLITDEAYRDGAIDPADNKVLQVFARFLRVEPRRAVELARWSRDKFSRGELGRPRPFEPLSLYRRMLKYALAGHEPGPIEKQMIVATRKLFGIDDVTHSTALHLLRADPAATQNIPVRHLRSVPGTGDTGNVAGADAAGTAEAPGESGVRKLAARLSRPPCEDSTVAIPLIPSGKFAAGEGSGAGAVAIATGGATGAALPEGDSGLEAAGSTGPVVAPDGGSTADAAASDVPGDARPATGRKGRRNTRLQAVPGTAGTGAAGTSSIKKLEEIPAWMRVALLSLLFVFLLSSAACVYFVARSV